MKKRIQSGTIGKRVAGWILAATMVVTMLPANALSVYAAADESGSAANASSSGGDAFSAIGIDTSVAPDGYDPNSTDNPYGRDTIKMNTVAELYTIGLGTDAGTLNKDLDAGTGSASAKGETSKDTKRENADLTASLYGDGAGLKTIEAALGKQSTGNVSSAELRATGNYTKLNSGTHNKDSNYSYKNYLTGIDNVESDQGVMFDVAAGNFDGNETGKSSQIAMVYSKKYAADGGLYLRFGDAKGTQKGAYGTEIELLSQNKKLGNPDLKVEKEDGSASDKKAENFAENPYQLKNYLQVATGDWNGDGMDEVAVYIPEENNSRIAIYALQKPENDGYKQASNWSLAWTYYLKEGNVVSNMISMTSGDVDRDGIDDLSCTWGYYYGPTQNKGSKAVVMFGAKGKDIFKRSQQFDVTYGSSNIVRASFELGDTDTIGSIDYENVPTKGVHALLVDDNELNIEIAKFFLEDNGMEVTCAYDGKEAVDIFRRRSIETRLTLIPRKTYTTAGYIDADLYSFLYYEISATDAVSDNAILLNLKSSNFAKLYFAGSSNDTSFIIDSSGTIIYENPGNSEILKDESLKRAIISNILADTVKKSGHVEQKGKADDYVCFYSSLDQERKTGRNI